MVLGKSSHRNLNHKFSHKKFVLKIIEILFKKKGNEKPGN